MKNIMFVGEAAGRQTIGRPAFSGDGGRRLATLCGVDHDEFLRDAIRVNLLDYRPDGGLFDLPKARQSWKTILDNPIYDRVRTFVFVGRRVRDAASVASDVPFFKFIVTGGRRSVVIPHPSRISHWWSQPANVATAQQFLTRLWKESITCSS